MTIAEKTGRDAEEEEAPRVSHEGEPLRYRWEDPDGTRGEGQCQYANKRGRKRTCLFQEEIRQEQKEGDEQKQISSQDMGRKDGTHPP